MSAAPKCGWTGKGRYRPVRCARVAKTVVLAERRAIIRCDEHAEQAVLRLRHRGFTFRTCKLPRAAAKAAS
jgi:hypothetical protein